MKKYNPSHKKKKIDYYRNRIINGISADDYHTNMSVFFNNFLLFLTIAEEVAPLLKKIEHDPSLFEIDYFKKPNHYRVLFDSNKKIYNFPDLLNNYIVHYKKSIHNIVSYIYYCWDDLEKFVSFHFEMMAYKNRSLPTWLDLRELGERKRLNVEEYLTESKLLIEKFLAVDIFDSTNEISLGDLKSVQILIDVLSEFEGHFMDMSRFRMNKVDFSSEDLDQHKNRILCAQLSLIKPLSYNINIDQLKNVRYHMTTDNFSLDELEKSYFFLNKKNPKKRGITLYRYTRDFDWSV